MTTTFYIDHFRTRNRLNGSHGHWRQRYREARQERTFVYEWLTHMLKGYPGPQFQGTVLLTRISPRLLDCQDALPASMKHTVDAIADYLTGSPCGTGNDRIPGVTWVYAQRRGGVKEYGVEVTFTEARDALVFPPDALTGYHSDEMPTARVMRGRETAGEEGLGW